MAKFIEFQEVMPHPGGVWLIRNKRSQDVLGQIEWYAQWRQYVAIFQESAVWSQDCLADVREFMKSRASDGSDR
jgi:hypothetical protein